MTTTTTALVIVDVQEDFCEGGALAVTGGNRVAAGIRALLEGDHGYDLVVATRDWHDPEGDNAGHFAAEPDYVGTWPAHCVAGTPGAAFHPDVAAAVGAGRVDAIVSKGHGEPAYSGFEGRDGDGRSLGEVLVAAGVTGLDIVGIATDHCVRATALDAVADGFPTRVLLSLCAAVSPSTEAAALAELAAAGVDVAGVDVAGVDVEAPR